MLYLQLRDAFDLHSLQARQMMKYMHNSKCFHFFYVDDRRQKVERVCAQEYSSYHEDKKKKSVAGAKDASAITADLASSLPSVPSLASLGSATIDTG